MNTEYVFNFRGNLEGRHAFTIIGETDLKRKIRQIDSGAGQSAGACQIEKHDGAPVYDDVQDRNNTSMNRGEYVKPGWYVVFFAGHADWYANEVDAMIAFIEDRTETRLV